MIDKILEKRHLGLELNEEEITYIVDGFLSGEIIDAQMTSILTSSKYKRLTTKEVIWFTEKSVNVSKNIKIRSKKIIIDKHSVGGIGDKFTLLLVPVLASLGFTVVKTSGTGLGITGGTIDKVLSIPGFNPFLSIKEVEKITSKNDMILFAHSPDFALIDEKIYNLRNQTNTANIIEWVAISVMTKKILIDSDLILIDLKVGDGAFCKTTADADKLIHYFQKIADHFKRKISIVVSTVNEPLGFSVGNACEVHEVISYLSGEKNSDLETLLKAFLNHLAKEYPLANTRIEEAIKSGKAFKKFVQLIDNQGGNFNEFMEKYASELAKMNLTEIKANKSGIFKMTKVSQIGEVSRDIGIIATSKYPTPEKYSAIFVDKKNNQSVKKNDVLIRVYSPEQLSKETLDKLKTCYRIDQTRGSYKLIVKMV
ncbi:hypothetical protein ASO20_02500 [Mycoplasma sp. (ex Biomphalaria glabrata)]|uniref:thymidine phosphorylase n=1 Tax=Mycoplasma sp. (ex Biomphalaria glabrata) TaxID=1749074 RepID=UPI00073A79C2|nr:thymidine phosphorylase [Mycoplasma sp. (ex Biomphalaria glabrata)]ALV23505.1 hypothetical protein ASO20_02500 [Mycoplasma sp. (ex Biomphalaria glabrata)]